ncbi:MAG: FAD-binding oxidoreductase, partial [Chromatiales bacterium]|nr:FAD-binding oxidoreductase [Chromatiales bacterium]
KPLSDTLEIEWGTEDAQPKLFPPRENVPFVVVERLERTPRIVELRLRPLGKVLRYWPGQYVIVGSEQDGATPRAYSIANSPRADGEISLQIAHVEDGQTSSWIHAKVQVGDTIRLSGPYGTFIGDPSAETPVLCLAAGTGLAPIMALAEAALSRGFKFPVTLLFSARTSNDAYDAGRLTLWQAKYRNFKFLKTLTREEGAELQGRIPDILPERFSDLSEYSVFVAGSPEFVDACVEVVKKLGAKEHLIHTEGFFEQQSPEVPDERRLMSN